MYKLNFLNLLIIITCHLSCKRTQLSYDEIQFKGVTDTSFINIIVEPESILCYEIERKNCKRPDICEHGPGFKCFKIKNNTALYLSDPALKFILSDEYVKKEPEQVITHAISNQLKILYKDSIIKEFRYYPAEEKNKLLRFIANVILNIVKESPKNEIQFNDHLFDLSSMAYVDSIKIIKFGSDQMSLIKTIKNKLEIQSLIERIQKLKIIKSPLLNKEESSCYTVKFKLDFYKHNQITYFQTSDGLILSFGEIQWLELDKQFIDLIN